MHHSTLQLEATASTPRPRRGRATDSQACFHTLNDRTRSVHSTYVSLLFYTVLLKFFMGRNYSVFYAALPWEAALRVIPRPSVHLFVPCPPLVENAKSYNVQTRYNARQE